MNGKRSTTQRDRYRRIIGRTLPACHICGQPIDLDLPYLDPGAFVVDHIIPLAKGGSDRLENLAGSHRSCNRTKGAHIIAPIVRRSSTLE